MQERYEVYCYVRDPWKKISLDGGFFALPVCVAQSKWFRTLQVTFRAFLYGAAGLKLLTHGAHLPTDGGEIRCGFVCLCGGHAKGVNSARHTLHESFDIAPSVMQLDGSSCMNNDLIFEQGPMVCTRGRLSQPSLISSPLVDIRRGGRGCNNRARRYQSEPLLTSQLEIPADRVTDEQAARMSRAQQVARFGFVIP